MRNLKHDVIMTVVLVLAVLFVAIAPALARKAGSSVIECKAGAVVTWQEDGSVRVEGECNVRGEDGCPVRPDADVIYSPYDESYPDPEGEVYPEPEFNECDVRWRFGVSCP